MKYCVYIVEYMVSYPYERDKELSLFHNIAVSMSSVLFPWIYGMVDLLILLSHYNLAVFFGLYWIIMLQTPELFDKFYTDIRTIDSEYGF